MKWLRKNLFSSTTNSLLTLLSLYLMYLAIPPLFQWAIFKADWSGDSREACQSGGACWVFIKVRFSQFIYGFYPESERWRVNIVFIIGFLATLSLVLKGFNWKRLRWLGGFALLGFVLLVGDVFGLPHVETSRWGGLMLTLVVSGVGIVASLPLGITLALGRRSKMPIIRYLTIAFIELWRSVPLITVLFMASVMLPLFIPQGVNFDNLLRALIGVILFSSAYMAEVVRGGLQAIPKGQFEAASSLGLNYVQTMRLIVLPQALRTVIPGIVNTFIGLFKDTTLVSIIGLFDLLGVVQAGLNDPKWLGLNLEGYVFAGLVFWVFCFGMSRYSRRLEKRLQIQKLKL